MLPVDLRINSFSEHQILPFKGEKNVNFSRRHQLQYGLYEGAAPYSTLKHICDITFYSCFYICSDESMRQWSWMNCLSRCESVMRLKPLEIRLYTHIYKYISLLCLMCSGFRKFSDLCSIFQFYYAQILYQNHWISFVLMQIIYSATVKGEVLNFFRWYNWSYLY